MDNGQGEVPLSAGIGTKRFCGRRLVPDSWGSDVAEKDVLRDANAGDDDRPTRQFSSTWSR